MFFSQYSSVVDYLIQKLDDKAKIIPKSKIALNNIVSLSELNYNKQDLSKFLGELEDDLTQGVQAIKTLNAQNRDLVEQLNVLEQKIKRSELKSMTSDKANGELNYKIGELLNENSDLKERINIINSESLEKVSYLEAKLENKVSQYEKLDQLNYELEKKIDALKEEIEELKLNQNNLNVNTSNRFSPKFNENSVKSEEYKSQHESTRSKGSIQKGSSVRDNKGSFRDLKQGNSPRKEIKELSDKSDSKRYNSLTSEREISRRALNDQISQHFKNKNDTQDYIHVETNNENEEIENPLANKGTFRSTNRSKKDSTERKKQTSSKRSSNNEKQVTAEKKVIHHVKTKSEEARDIALRVSDMVMKVTSSTDYINHLNKTIGKDFLSKLLSNDVNATLITEIERQIEIYDKKKHESNRTNTYILEDETTAITNQSKLKNLSGNTQSANSLHLDSGLNSKKGLISRTSKSPSATKKAIDYSNIVRTSNQSLSKIPLNVSDLSDERKTREDNLSRSKSKSKSKEKREYVRDTYENKCFENSLRKYKNYLDSSNLSAGNASGLGSTTANAKSKVFNNYTSLYGRYFDKDLIKEKATVTEISEIEAKINHSKVQKNELLHSFKSKNNIYQQHAMPQEMNNNVQRIGEGFEGESSISKIINDKTNSESKVDDNNYPIYKEIPYEWKNSKDFFETEES